MPAGRPTVMTQNVTAKLKVAFAMDVKIEAACAYAGIHKDTYYEYLKKHPEFADEVEDLRRTPYLKAVQSVIGKLDDPEYALKYLERKHRDEYSTRQEHTGADGEALHRDKELEGSIKELLEGMKDDGTEAGDDTAGKA